MNKYKKLARVMTFFVFLIFFLCGCSNDEKKTDETIENEKSDSTIIELEDYIKKTFWIFLDESPIDFEENEYGYVSMGVDACPINYDNYQIVYHDYMENISLCGVYPGMTGDEMYEEFERRKIAILSENNELCYGITEQGNELTVVCESNKVISIAYTVNSIEYDVFLSYTDSKTFMYNDATDNSSNYVSFKNIDDNLQVCYERFDGEKKWEYPLDNEIISDNLSVHINSSNYIFRIGAYGELKMIQYNDANIEDSFIMSLDCIEPKENFDDTINSTNNDFTSEEIIQYGYEYLNKAIMDTSLFGYYVELVRAEEGMKTPLGYTATFYVYVPDMHSYKYIRVNMVSNGKGGLNFSNGSL